MGEVSPAGGLDALRQAEHFGRPERMSELRSAELVGLQKAGSLAAGFATEPRNRRSMQRCITLAAAFWKQADISRVNHGLTQGSIVRCSLAHRNRSNPGAHLERS